MELSRQRLRPALAETSYIPCPRCTGTGHIRSTESAALHILRILEEEAMKENTGAVHVQVPVDVATFLLNEKRPDIQAIELRHKVTILLIPNVHLETPAHTITRLRHDDLNQDDVREPSYKMVDMPIEDAIKQATQQEAAKPRQEAAIKGVSPEQPAPIMPEKSEAPAPATAVAKPEGGLFSKIFSWFRSAPQPVEPVAAPEPTKKPREARSDNRRERDGRRGGRNGSRREEERGERPERSKERGNRNNERNAEKPALEDAAANTGERQERRPRGERKERRERQQPEVIETKLAAVTTDTSADTTSINANEAPDANNGGEEQGARRRGRRGGRGRGERRNEAEAVGMPEVAATAETSAEPINQEPVVVVIPAAEPAVVAEAAEVVAVTEMAVAPASENITPAVEAAVEPIVVTPPVVEVEAAPIEVVEAPVVTEPAAPVVEPVNIETALADSGLVLVQTTSSPVVVAQAEPPVKLGRPRKQQIATQADSEALIMVETGK